GARSLFLVLWAAGHGNLRAAFSNQEKTPSMSHAAAIPDHSANQAGFSFGAATSGKVGMWVFLLTDAMSFGGLLLAYGILRAGSHDWPDPSTRLGIPFTAGMTFILICSSVTMVMALAGAQEKDKKRAVFWLAMTVLGGLLFLCGQAK